MSTPYERLFGEERELQQRRDSATSGVETSTDAEGAYNRLFGQKKNNRLQSSIETASRRSPSRNAELQRKAEQTGLDMETVEKNEAMVDRGLNRRKIDPDALRTKSPATADWLEDPKNAAVAYDDVDNLSETEERVRGWEAANERVKRRRRQLPEPDEDMNFALAYPSRGGAGEAEDIGQHGAIAEGVTQADAGLTALAGVYDVTDRETAAQRLAAIGARRQQLQENRPEYARDYNEMIAEEAPKVEQVRQAWISQASSSLEEGGPMGALGYGLNSLAGFADTVLTALGGIGAESVKNPAGFGRFTTKTLVQSSPGMVAGAGGAKAGSVAGVPGALLGFAGGTIAGQAPIEAGAVAYQKLLERVDDPTDPEQIKQALADPELVEEMKSAGMRKGVTTASVDGLFNLVAGKAVTKPFTAASRVGKAAQSTGRGVQEVGVQTQGEIAAESSGQLAQSGEVDAGEAAVEGVAGAGMSVAETAIGANVRRNMRDGRDSQALKGMIEGQAEAEGAKEQAAHLQGVNEKVKDSELAGRDPEKLKELAEKFSEGEVYVNPDDFQEFFQEQGEDPAEVGRRLVGDEAYNRAVTMGQDMAIPMSSYVSEIAPRQDADEFTSIVRGDPDAMSQRDAEAFEAEREELVNEYLNREPISESSERVREDVQGQLEAAGARPEDAESQARLWQAFFSAMGERTGRDPQELYERYSPRINRQMPEALRGGDQPLDMQLAPMLSRLRAGEIPGEREAFGPSLTEFLREQGGINDEGGELSAMDADAGRRPFQRSLARQGDGMDPDQAAERAMEEGFLDEFDQGRLFELIDQELRGQPVYSPQNLDEASQGQREALMALDEELGRAGITDLDALSDREIADIIEGRTTAGPSEQDGGNVLEQAREQGYEGDSESEAAAWIRAAEKGLDMSQEARMERARELGFDPEFVLYSGGPELTSRIAESTESAGAVFDGIFASPRREAAEAFGEQVDELIVREDGILSDFALNYELEHERVKDAFDDIVGQNLSDDVYEDVWSLVVEDVDIQELANQESVIEAIPGASDSADVAWKAQNLRGRLASELGFDAVEMADETGISYFIPSGSQVRSIHAAFDPAAIRDPNMFAQDGTFDPQDPNILRQDDDGRNLEEDGFGVEDLSNDRATREILEQYFRSVEDRDGDRGGQESPWGDARTSAGTRPDESWASETAIRDGSGQPARIKRGGRRLVGPSHFDPEVLGANTGQIPSGFGVWFATDPKYAERFGPVNDFYLDIRNPAVFAPGPGDLPNFNSAQEAQEYSQQLREQGYDGIVLDLTEIGSGKHFVAFDPEQVIIPEDTLQQDDTQQLNQDADTAAGPLLAAQHNMTADNLRFADELGGIAAPSVGVVTEQEGGLEGFGEISLIGNRSLVDPQREPVFSSDAYSQTFPRPEYGRADTQMANQLAERFQEADQRMGVRARGVADSITEWAGQKSDPEQLVNDMRSSNSAKAVYLEEVHGQSVDPVMRDAPLDTIWADTGAIRQWLDENPDVNLRQISPGDPEWTSLSEAADLAIDEWIEKYDDDVGAPGGMRESMKREAFGRDGSELTLAAGDRLNDSVKNLGQQEVDANRTRQMLDEQLEGRWAGFDRWIKEQVMPMYPEPQIRVGRRKVPYTLDNIVEAMTRQGSVKGQEQSLVVGGGQARAQASQQFGDLEQMREAAQDAIVDPAEYAEAKKETEAVQEEFRQQALDYYGPRSMVDPSRPDTWGGYDAAMRAIGRVAGLKRRNKQTMRTALRREEFNVGSMPDDVLEKGLEAVEQTLKAPVPYFEAKPQRAVKLSEFEGAVIPEDADQDVRDILERNGIEYVEAPQDRRQDAIRVLRRKLADEGKEVLFQRTGDQPRGFIQFDSARNFAITLTERANLSTFLHESGHFFLEVMADLAAEDANIAEDFNAALEWLGAESRDDITLEGKDPNSEAFQAAVERHEKWARGFEKYLMEGNAPSEALRKAFARFRSWLMAIYRRIRNLDVNLSDEVRGVMDRMLATDEEIAQARDVQEYRPLYETAEQAGMTEEEFQEYQDAVDAAAREAETEVTRQAMEDYRREERQWWKDESEQVRQEVLAELNDNPVYVALSVLRTGKMPDGSDLPEGVEPFKLAKGPLAERYGQKFLSDNLRRLNIYRKDEGVNFEVAAERFGFQSGDEMIQKIIAAPKQKDFVEAETMRRMHERHPDMMQSGELPEQAMEEVHNDKQRDTLLMETRMLGRKIGRRPSTRQVAKRIAQDVVGRTPVKSLRPHVYRRAETRAARKAFEAAAAGDNQTAFNEKQKQLVNFELYREAVRARDEADSIFKYAKRLSKKAAQQRIGKAGGGYLEQINHILETYEFRRVPLKQLDKRQGLREWLDEQAEQGLTPQVPEYVQQQAERVNYRELPMEELRGVRDALKSIEHVASTKNQLLASKDKRDYEEAVEALVAGIEENASRPAREQDPEPRLPEEETRRGVREFLAMHRRMSSLVREMDGFKKGPMWEFILRPIKDAGAREATMNQELGDEMKKLFDMFTKDERRKMFQKEYLPEVDQNLSKQAILSMALNWGNADNRQKLIDGYSWLNSEAQVEQVLSRLTKRDWDFVQGVWDLVDSYWPQIEQLEKDLNGVAPEKVPAQQVITKHGAYRGGYYPLKYDDLQDTRAYADTMKELAEEGLRGKSSKEQTKAGSTKERVTGVNRPVRLDLGVMNEHFGEVIHDITHRKALIDAVRLLESNRVKSQILKHYGFEVWRQLDDTWRDIAAGDVPARDSFERGLNYLRNGASVAMLGWRLSTAALQPLGLTQSMVRIGPQWVLRGSQEFFGTPSKMQQAVSQVYEKSDFMRNRADTMSREINDVMNKAFKTGRFRSMVEEVVSKATADKIDMEKLEDSYFYFITRMQMMVDMPTWLGAYHKARETGEATDEAEAIAIADQAVIDAQAGGQIKDQAAIQRGHPFRKLFTNFMSFFVSFENNMAESYRRTDFSKPRDVGRFATDMLLLSVIPSVIPTLASTALGGGDEDEDLGELATTLAGANLSYLMGSLVGVREFSGAVQGYTQYEGPPGTMIIGSSISTATQLWQVGEEAVSGGDVSSQLDEPLMDSAAETTGILFHMPLPGLLKSAKGAHQMMMGETKNPSVLVTGPKKD